MTYNEGSEKKACKLTIICPIIGQFSESGTI